MVILMYVILYLNNIKEVQEVVNCKNNLICLVF